MGAALGPRHGVDLVQDDRVDASQDLARRRRQHQVQRFRCRDQDVRRPPLELPPVCRRGVARPHPDGRLAHVEAEPFRGEADAGERRPQVLLNVDGERAKRRDVQHPAPPLRERLRLGHEAVDRPEERGERLA
jgi:hypothetical protein